MPASGLAPASAGLSTGEATSPRLFLYAPYYLRAGGLREAPEMSVDVAEYYFHALLEARFDLVEGRGGSAYGSYVVARSANLLADVPESQRGAAYLDAVADFGAHVLSLVQEILRIESRHRPSGARPGSEVCRLLDHPASLFALWRTSLQHGAFVGQFEAERVSAGEADDDRWVISRHPLAWRDKENFLREVFGRAWTGDPAQDFAWLCFPEAWPAG